MKKGYVYINSNKTNKVLYIGVTNNLERRAYEHKYRLDSPSSFCYRYRITKLVYYETYEDIGEAIYREKQLKNLLRSKKIKLINFLNPDWNDLFTDL
jgi:putative endonuclease